jgi:uncharacterized protein with PIN domain
MLGGLARWLRAAGYDASWHDGALVRVPPRSLAWHERFWECRRCGRAFWHGSHWREIAEKLQQAAP